MELESSEIFKVLSVARRVEIIELLKSKGPIGTKSISEAINITPAAVSQHLKALRQAGLVRRERRGYWIPYSIDTEALESCRQVLEQVCKCGCEMTDRFIEKENLEQLKRYEKELQQKLMVTRERIEEIETKKE